MFFNNDAWFINESSLDFYLSTNTFNNPMFDVVHNDHYDDDDNNNEIKFKGENSLGITKKESNSTNKNNVEDDKSKPNNNNNIKIDRKVTVQENKSKYFLLSSLKGRCANICDNFIFSIKSKIYVMELNLKRHVRNLETFSNKRMPWVFNNFLFSTNEQTNLNNANKLKRNLTDGDIKYLESYLAQQKQISYNSCLYNNLEQESFWKNFTPPSCKKSLNLQKGRILSRLEQVVQAKRNQQDYMHHLEDYLNNCFNYHHSTSSNSIKSSTSRCNDRLIRSISSWSSESIGSQSTLSSPSSSVSLSYSTLLANNIKKNKNTQDQKPVKNSYLNGKKNRRGWVTKSSNSFSKRVNNLNGNINLSESKKLCVVCYTNQPNIVTLPCKHDDICSDCFIELIYMAVKNSKFPLKCILCRQKIEKIRCSKRLILSVIEKNRLNP